MNKMMGIIGLALLFSGVGLKAQDVPKVEVFGGYSYLNIDINGLGSRQNANGWETSVSENFNRWLAAEYDVSGFFKTYSPVRVTDYSYLAGPRFNFRLLFVHGLLGGDHLTGTWSGESLSQDSLAGAVGGGMQLPVTRLISFRASVDYVFSRHDIVRVPSVTQNNVRVSSGVVFTFGGGRRANRPALVGPVAPIAQSTAQPPAQPPAQAPAVAPLASKSETTSFGVVGYATDEGFKVTSVRDGSVAERIYIFIGDVIWEIDGKPVRSGQDVDAAFAANKGGTIKVRNENVIPSVRELKLR
jgi:membrane-associated protease RseP (regulator of RpoE activity)